LHWSHRAATQAAQKTPVDWDKKCSDTFLRGAYQVKVADIPADLVLNGDQTGVSVLPVAKQTWEETGAKQVAVLAKEEKRQFTCMVTSAASGAMLPIQSIWQGKTNVSLPQKSLRRESESYGNRWVSGGERHWSSLKSMKAVSIGNSGGSRLLIDCFPHT